MRQLTFTALLTGLIFGVANAPAAQAAPGEGISMTHWEMHEGEGLLSLETPIQRFGAKRLYPLSEVPTLDDEGWRLAPSGAQIEFDQRSLLCGTPTSCFDGADFTYFQTLLTLPEGERVGSITLSFDAIDDGVQVTVFNSRHPEGRSLPGAALFRKLDIQETPDLGRLFVRGEDNRVVVTLLDNCCGRVMLMGAQLKVDGEPVSGLLD